MKKIQRRYELEHVNFHSRMIDVEGANMAQRWSRGLCVAQEQQWNRRTDGKAFKKNERKTKR